MPDVYAADQLPLFTTTRTQDARLAASFDRLCQPDYDTAAVIAETIVDAWPGDLAGRLLLSLSRFARAGFPALPHATELVEGMLEAVNAEGYFGEVLGEVVDEQQVACHGWVVSGLLQYAAVSGDARASVAAFRIVDALLLPALARLDSYPFERDTSADVGEASGSAEVILNGWRLSTDIWCVFLALNGLVPSFQQSGRSDIAAAIVLLRAVLDRVDVVAKRAQLHATLAAARCLADFAEAGGVAARPAVAGGAGGPVDSSRDTAVVADANGSADATAAAAATATATATAEFRAAAATAVRLYNAYAAHGRTLNYATFNWFGRPDSWTEPCAIVDSLALAYTLWRLTGEQRYLDDAQRIEYNALDTAERANGSFGLDSVMTPEHPELREVHPDARWCCTMRGALGLLEARENSVALASTAAPSSSASAPVSARGASAPVNGVAIVPTSGLALDIVGFHSGTIAVAAGSAGEWMLRETTAYPAAPEVRFDVIRAPENAVPLTLTLRYPGGSQTLVLAPRVGAAVEAEIPLAVTEESVGSGLVAVFRGPVLQSIHSAGTQQALQPDLTSKA
ncbi:hypothetical protein [Subtercola lobariae]|uniref:Uncharacterized protein n=1 Tax=Subtercola lobariae TaxID=1588641 RepID=A0A917BF61_9MICO|nr:hypothetical protein [Subtercola lobariae]GGF37792.1 hypothetical protein GCM10011399_33440 [Subtercola lobariae]